MVTDTLRSFWPGNVVEMDLVNVAKKMMSGATLVKTTSFQKTATTDLLLFVKTLAIETTIYACGIWPT